jgi:hypothetical protein
LWNELIWRRKPHIQRLELCILEQDELLWLYQVEDVVLMVEVNPTSSIASNNSQPIGQVVLKRLITAEQAIGKLSSAEVVSKGTA